MSPCLPCLLLPTNDPTNASNPNTHRYLSISSNPELGGSIPSALGRLARLSVLDFADNTAVAGPIPAALSGLVALRQLQLRNCALTGNLPVGLASLRNLVSVDVALNYLGGAIPTQFQAWHGVAVDTCDNNNNFVPPSAWGFGAACAGVTA